LFVLSTLFINSSRDLCLILVAAVCHSAFMLGGYHVGTLTA